MDTPGSLSSVLPVLQAPRAQFSLNYSRLFSSIGKLNLLSISLIFLAILIKIGFVLSGVNWAGLLGLFKPKVLACIVSGVGLAGCFVWAQIRTFPTPTPTPTNAIFRFLYLFELAIGVGSVCMIIIRTRSLGIAGYNSCIELGLDMFISPNFLEALILLVLELPVYKSFVKPWSKYQSAGLVALLMSIPYLVCPLAFDLWIESSSFKLVLRVFDFVFFLVLSSGLGYLRTNLASITRELVQFVISSYICSHGLPLPSDVLKSWVQVVPGLSKYIVVPKPSKAKTHKLFDESDDESDDNEPTAFDRAVDCLDAMSYLPELGTRLIQEYRDWMVQPSSLSLGQVWNSLVQFRSSYLRGVQKKPETLLEWVNGKLYDILVWLLFRAPSFLILLSIYQTLVFFDCGLGRDFPETWVWVASWTRSKPLAVSRFYRVGYLLLACMVSMFVLKLQIRLQSRKKYQYSFSASAKLKSLVSRADKVIGCVSEIQSIDLPQSYADYVSGACSGSVFGCRVGRVMTHVRTIYTKCVCE